MADLKSLLFQTARLNGTPYKHGLPCDDTIRLFRAKHREITFRNYESKDLAKLKGECFEHVDPFLDIVSMIGEKHAGLLSDGDRIWNLDETAVDPELGKKLKVFSDASSHHGGSRVACSGSGRHVTAVIAASASGRVCPPFSLSKVHTLCQTGSFHLTRILTLGQTNDWLGT